MTHQTGIAELDRKLGGGIPPGTLVAVETPARAQREPLLCAGADERSTTYFTTVRSEGAIAKQFERSAVNPDVESVVEVDPESAPETIGEALAKLSEGQDFIVDVVDPIEDALDRQRYAAFLNDVTERLRDSDSIGYLHGYAGDRQSTQRQVTLDVADFV